jgi:hypothetical protein
MEIGEIRLIGLNAETAIQAAPAVRGGGGVTLLRLLVGSIVPLLSARTSISVIAFVSIGFDDPVHLTTVLGLATAGLAIAAQRAVTSFAGYLVIMRASSARRAHAQVPAGRQSSFASAAHWTRGSAAVLCAQRSPPAVLTSACAPNWIASPGFDRS